MNMHSQPYFDKRAKPFGARLAALAAASQQLIAGACRRRSSGPLLMAGGRNDGPPDLDELWRDFNKKLSGLFNGKGGGGNQPPPQGGSGNGGPSFQPDMKSAGIGIGLIGLVVAVVWAGSGFFIGRGEPLRPFHGIFFRR